MALQKDKVIVVNERDEWMAVADKLEAHRQGTLHRALSVFLLNSKGEMLLQQRAIDKYHSGGLWSNACCSHPAPGESTIAAAHRRLKEEMGFDCQLLPAFILRYTAEVGNGLVENEYDHVFTGIYDGTIETNAAEVNAHRFVSLNEIERLLKTEAENFTPWFHLGFAKFLQYRQKQEVI